MCSILPRGGHELADLTYEVTQLRHTLLEQAVGLDAVVKSHERLNPLGSSAMLGSQLDSELIGKALEISRQESMGPISVKKDQIWAPIRNIVVEDFRVAEVRPNVLKLWQPGEESGTDHSMLWLGAEADDDSIILTKRQRWLASRPGRPSMKPLEIQPKDTEIVKCSIAQLCLARDVLKSQVS